jgi:hypothetical protein
VKQFVAYIITEGQNSAEGLQYTKLPQSLAEQNQKLLAELPPGGQPTSGDRPSQ